MKFYVAGKWQEREKIQRLQKVLIDRGHAITIDWTQHVNPEDQSTLRDWAERDIEGVQACDIYLGVFDNHNTVYTGALVEMGVAIGLGKRTWLIGNAVDHCIFLAHPLVTKFQTEEDMLKVLDCIPRE